jgi:hypothetical protein
MSRDLQEGPTDRTRRRLAARDIIAADVPDMIDAAHRLAAMALQSNRYITDADYRDAVDDLLSFTLERRNGIAPTPIPTIAVFVEGGLIQDICFDGAVRVVVLDFDVDTDDSDHIGIYTDPRDGKASRAWVSVWERGDMTNDPKYVQAALRAAGEV